MHGENKQGLKPTGRCCGMSAREVGDVLATCLLPHVSRTEPAFKTASGVTCV